MAIALVGGGLVGFAEDEVLLLLSIMELLGVRMVERVMDLLEEGRTGSSSSSSAWGVRATVEDAVGTVPRMSERA